MLAWATPPLIDLEFDWSIETEAIENCQFTTLETSGGLGPNAEYSGNYTEMVHHTKEHVKINSLAKFENV